MTPMARAKTEVVTLPTPDLRMATIRIIGTSALISHKWSEKAKKEMLDKQMKKATKKKEAKNPERDYQESLYHLPDGGHGFPAIAFKSAAVTACSQIDGMTKVLARGAFHVLGELVPIEGEPQMREDMVRIGMGVADIRYRGEFTEWACDVPIQYNASVISLEQLINLFQYAGFAVGIGEWRPEKNGNYGMFRIAGEEE
jgi:hypothetical protein